MEDTETNFFEDFAPFSDDAAGQKKFLQSVLTMVDSCVERSCADDLDRLHAWVLEQINAAPSGSLDIPAYDLLEYLDLVGESIKLPDSSARSSFLARYRQDLIS